MTKNAELEKVAATTATDLVAHTVTVNRAKKNANDKIRKADGSMLRVALPEGVLALRGCGMRTGRDFSEGQRTEGSKSKVIREAFIASGTKATGSDRAAKTWWDRLQAIAKDRRFAEFTTPEGFANVLQGHTTSDGEASPVESLKALDRMLKGEPDPSEQAAKRLAALAETLEKMSDARLAVFKEDNAGDIAELIAKLS